MNPRWMRHERLASLLVVVGALIVALVSARPYAGSWNDGSRLATVEALVDHHSLAIDQSIFVGVPEPGCLRAVPYRSDDPRLSQFGTADKLLIGGRYYSDKSPVPALLLAGAYQGWQWCTGLIARDRADVFCYLMTQSSSGVAYVAAVWCVFALGGVVPLSLPLRLMLTASFALSTVSLPYVRHTNNHILLLAVAAAITLLVTRLAEVGRCGRTARGSVAVMGFLAGLGYTIDLGVGPVLWACLLLYVGWRFRSLSLAATFVLAALPWLLLHHGVNYAVGGTIKPANAVAEYFRWPGCPFNQQNMTGSLKHSPGTFVLYSLSLLFGKRGFLGHNLPLFLALVGSFVLLRRRVRELPELLLALAWCGGTWLVYALTSNNSAGQCCTIRWFVPFLAPGYYVIAVLLKHFPHYTKDFVVLSLWGMLEAGLMWWEGPWMSHMVPGFWVLQGLALLSSYWIGPRQRRKEQASVAPVQSVMPTAVGKAA